MKALKSPLAAHILRSGIRIPLAHDSRFDFQGIKYVVKIVPKAAVRGI